MDRPICSVMRNQWRGGRARHRPCLPKPLQFTREAPVSLCRRNGIVAAKVKDESRFDHRTMVLVQTQRRSGTGLRNRLTDAIPEISLPSGRGAASTRAARGHRAAKLMRKTLDLSMRTVYFLSWRK